jgi:hypothetical protein
MSALAQVKWWKLKRVLRLFLPLLSYRRWGDYVLGEARADVCGLIELRRRLLSRWFYRRFLDLLCLAEDLIFDMLEQVLVRDTQSHRHHRYQPQD